MDYFIVTAEPISCSWITAGSICYKNEDYFPLKSENRDTLHVNCVAGFRSGDLPAAILQPLTRQQSEFLLALASPAERLKEITKPENFEQARKLTVGSEVTVEQDGEWLKGVVRYIGPLDINILDHLNGVFFGVQLQNQTSVSQTISIMGWAPENLAQSLNVGDRVAYVLDDKSDCQHGMVLGTKKDGMILISTAMDEHGKAGGEREIPWHCIIKEESSDTDLWQKCQAENMDISKGSDLYQDSVADVDIKVGSKVEVNIAKGPACATVRWIGSLPNRNSRMAGLELEEPYGVSDGTFGNNRYFKCPPRHGLFVRVSSCRLSDRSLGETAINGHFDQNEQYTMPIPPISSEDVTAVLTGRMKGIQGHCNSCYMDSALFSLFASSSVLDSLLFKKTKPSDEPIQKTLLMDIVCPLRSKGFVPNGSMMKLRKQVQERGHCPSYTTDEKDPEEFLNLIMQDILSLEPLLKLKSFNQNKGLTEMEQTSYLYQIFMDYNHTLVLPTVQQLLEHSFYNNDIKLSEVPSCLILTMPRSGKQFKMFPKIIPSLQVDITDLLSYGPQQCVLCGNLAGVECNQCFMDSVFSNKGLKVFCSMCSDQVHSHPSRQSHKPTSLRLPEGFPNLCNADGLAHIPPREKLELFAVLCIETSHYVSFVKHGPKDTDWVFFDSMADRVGETDGYNIPEVKACPEVAQYLSMPLAELAKQVPREMAGVAKRLFCDGYMYLYQSPSMALYH